MERERGRVGTEEMRRGKREGKSVVLMESKFENEA